MKKSFLLFFVLAVGFSFLWFSGCTKKEEEQVGWAIPRFDKKPVETAKAVKKEYEVKEGDYITAIAEQYGISPLRLAEANGLKLKGRESIIYPGQKLIIPQE